MQAVPKIGQSQKSVWHIFINFLLEISIIFYPEDFASLNVILEIVILALTPRSFGKLIFKQHEKVAKLFVKVDIYENGTPS